MARRRLPAVYGMVAAITAAWMLMGATPCGAQRPAPGTPGTIAGKITDSLSAPVAGAVITLDTLGLRTTTDSTGQFRMLHVPPGRRVLSVSHVGFAPATFRVSLAAGDALYDVFQVARAAVALPAVKTQAVGQFGKPARLAYTMRYDEFYERRAAAVAGLFYTHEDLLRMNTADFPDMLRRVPGLRLRQNLDGTQLAFPGCSTNHILIVLDHQRIWPPAKELHGGSGTVPLPPIMSSSGPVPTHGIRENDPFELLQSLHIQNVEAMEVYKNVAQLPVDAGGDVCGAIYIWTR